VEVLTRDAGEGFDGDLNLTYGSFDTTNATKRFPHPWRRFPRPLPFRLLRRRSRHASRESPGKDAVSFFVNSSNFMRSACNF